MVAPHVPAPLAPDPATPGAPPSKQPDPAPAPISTPGKAALVLLLGQIPVIGGGVTAVFNTPLATWAKEHPGTAVLIVLAYEAMLLVGGVLKKVWSNLELEVVTGLTEGTRLLAGAARARLLNLVSRYRRRYLRRIRIDHRSLNVRGLRTQGAFTIHLEHVFVEVRIAPNSAHKASLSTLGGKEISGSRPVWDFLRRTAKGEGEALAILGAPGSGKTTLLQYVALTLAAQRQRRHRLRTYVPIFLALRDHTATIVAGSPPSLGELAQTFFAKKLGEPSPPGWFERQLQAGACLVLLDGLDEVADDEARVRVSAWVDQQISAYPGSPFVLTARPRGYATAPLARAHALEILPFGAEQVRSFVRNWYLANEIMRAGGQEDEGVRLTAENQAKDLLQRLRSRPALDELTRNPLLLTMIATVHSQRNALPGGRVELYGEICDVLLGHWQRAKGLTQPLSVGQLRGVLEPLAAQMMQEGVRELRTAEVLAVVQGSLAEVGVTGEAVATFLTTLQAASGLFVEREHDAWGFAHLSFQEYLASTHLRKHGGHLGWAALIQDSWWHETLRLYAAQGDATALLQASLALDTVPALSLAIECLDEAQRIEPTLRAEAEQRLVADLESPDEPRRRIAAEVRIARRLRGFQRIDDEREIDPGYVTCAEYQLFLDDKHRQDAFFQPDHWISEQFPQGYAETFAGGVRFADACAFADWLTARHGGDAVYRLPTPQEAAQHSASSTEATAAWCSSEGSPCLIGLTDDQEQSFRERMQPLSALRLPPSVTRTSDLARAREFVIVLDLELDRVLDRSLARNGDRSLAREFDHDFAHALTFHLARNGDPDLARALEIDIALARTRDRSLARALARDLARALARYLTRARYLDLDLEKADISAVLNIFKEPKRSSTDFPQPLAALLCDLLDLRTASTSLARRQASYRYLAHLMEYAWDGHQQRIPREPRPWYQRWPSRSAPQADPADATSDAILTLHWWAQLTLARLDGALPAWEGIRLVRERRV